MDVLIVVRKNAFQTHFTHELFSYTVCLIVKKNVILACEASSPSTLSDYCKKVCEEARISLNSAELNDQRKRISIKTNTLIKLVIKDKYDC